ncbi:ragulator complex protein LAMTOR4 homolog isoform X2 [Periplaneta americana]
MLNLERIPDQVGYLLLAEDGAVISSGGELENDERVANIIYGLITLTDKVDTTMQEEGFKRISVVYDDHCYVICLSNKKIHVVKRKFAMDQMEPVIV